MDTAVFLALDFLRGATMFLLGLALTFEVAVVRLSHTAILSRGGGIWYVPLYSNVARAVSRSAAMIFMALEIHERFGHTLSYRLPLAFFVALASLISTLVIVRHKAN